MNIKKSCRSPDANSENISLRKKAEQIRLAMSEAAKLEALMRVVLNLEQKTEQYAAAHEKSRLLTLVLQMEFPKCDKTDDRLESSMRRMIYVRNFDKILQVANKLTLVGSRTSWLWK